MVSSSRTRRATQQATATQANMKRAGKSKTNFFSRFRNGESILSRHPKEKPTSKQIHENEITENTLEFLYATTEIREEIEQPSSADTTVGHDLEQVVVSMTGGPNNEITYDDILPNQSDELVLVSSVSTSDQWIESRPFCFNPSYCATAVLQHSYLDRMCIGGRSKERADTENSSVESPTVPTTPTRSRRQLCRRASFPADEPRHQESIECMFASQLEDGMAQSLLSDSDNDCTSGVLPSNELRSILAPSVLQQSLSRPRTHSTLHNPLCIQNQELDGTPKDDRIVISAKLIHIGTFDPCQSRVKDDLPALASVSNSSGNSSSSIISDKPINNTPKLTTSMTRCGCCRRFSPVVHPELWPQRPLLLRPTPGSGTKVKGIRFANQTEYIWDGRNSNVGWWDVLRKHWKRSQSNIAMDTLCRACMILPINNGNEAYGESLVTDFESELFEGTLLVRVRGAQGTSKEPYDDTKGYFSDVNRKYQAVIQGRFKNSIPWTECLSGIR
jgi:Protein of unknown function (DUF1769)